ncbi:MAG TPA: substrate-binding domain-containing protein [Amycolatopsis sp.]|nr:substrate-binding domain-containing protein [Amycolatopsis sp.]
MTNAIPRSPPVSSPHLPDAPARLSAIGNDAASYAPAGSNPANPDTGTTAATTNPAPALTAPIANVLVAPSRHWTEAPPSRIKAIVSGTRIGEGRGTLADVMNRHQQQSRPVRAMLARATRWTSDLAATAGRFHVNRERLRGYLGTLDHAGIDTGSVPIWETSGISREHAMASELLDQERTAWLCMSDELALAALGAAKHRSIEVPTELSIVGLDDTSAARWPEPALTTAPGSGAQGPRSYATPWHPRDSRTTRATQRPFQKLWTTIPRSGERKLLIHRSRNAC